MKVISMSSEKKTTRKLRAILSADVKGYSLLMANDEAFTIKTLKEYRVIMSEQIQGHDGRIVDAPGDNLLAEFSSAVDAVECAVEIQKRLKMESDNCEEDKKLKFRIGVNIGDVVQDDDRIYGSGVNVAARIEGLADPGGVCISRNVYDQIKDKLNLGYEYLGDHEVKNIKEPVRVYKVLTDSKDAGKLIGEKAQQRRKKWPALAVATVAILIGIIVWQFYYEKSPPIEAASIENMALPLPDKPSIAVLPFDNLSGDPEQEYFSDGITEEIITALSQTPKMFVIARHSTSVYKGKPVKIKQVAEELGVRYVLEGGIQKEGDRVRITAQLIDALSGHNVWAKKYDRDLKELFTLQDEITMEIINALQVELTEGEHARLWRKGTDNLEAYLKFLKARELYLTQTKENNAEAQRIAKEAIALDPEYPPPYHVLSVTYFYDLILGITKSPAESVKKAIEAIQKAIALDDSYAQAHGWLGSLYVMLLGEYDKGVMEAQKGVALDPNGAHNYIYLETALRFAGRHEEAVQAIEKAIRLNPFPPVTYYQHACMDYVFAKEYDKAIAAGEEALKVASPNDWGTRTALTTAYSLAGREEEARSMAKEILRINPKYSTQKLLKVIPYKNTSDSDLIAGALAKAGLPE
jgi:adenylate cyclase